jgi:DNA-binding response OmpR family regulator
VLVAEDSTRLLRTLSAALRRSGYAVDAVSDGEEAFWLALDNDYDAAVLDIMLPKRDGLDVVRSLRAKGKMTHVLLLTAKDTVADRVEGLSAGADDYLVKPFAIEELLARVRALCRRAYGSKRTLIRLGDLEVDLSACTVSRSGAAIELTAREFQLLEYLVQRAGSVVTRTEIEAHIYDNRVEPMSNVVDSAICALRKKLAAFSQSSPLIHTRRGLGYVLDAGAAPGG